MNDNSLFPDFENPVTEEPMQNDLPIAEEQPSEEEFAALRPTPAHFATQNEEEPPIAPTVEHEPIEPSIPTFEREPIQPTHTEPVYPTFRAEPVRPTYTPPVRPTYNVPPVQPTPSAYIPMQPTYTPSAPPVPPNYPPMYPSYTAPIPPVRPTAPAYNPTTPAYERPTRPTAKAKKKKGMGWRIALIAVCCALAGSILGGILVGSYFSNQDGKTTYSGTQTIVSQTPIIAAPPSSLAELYNNAVPSIVGVTNEYTTYGYFGSSTAGATGTGFIISTNGEILTNYHVVENAQKLTVTLYDGTEYPAELLGYEAESDVALLKIDATNLPALPLGNSDILNVGDQIAAIGNPLGELTYTMTVGYVSAKGRAVYTDEMPINMLQIDAAINSGNSGGPLFNLAGEVIGITTAKYSGSISGSANIEGIGFAIPINDVLSILNDLREYGSVQNRAYIGVVVTNSQAGGDIPTGALVQSVEKNSSGDKAGLRVSDIIVAVGDRTVSGIDTLYQALRPYRAGDTVELTVFRSGETITLSITFDATPAETEQQTTEIPTEGFEFPWG